MTVSGLSSSAFNTPNVVLPNVPVILLPKIGSTMRRVWTAVRMLPSPPVPAMLKRPMPSMKNGRFSEKNTGKRWFTCTWNESLSTWLKSGLIVPSSVIPDVMPSLPLMPRPHLSSAPFQLVGVVAILIDAVGHARQRFDQAPGPQVAEDQTTGPIEHPLAGQHLRPRVRHADAADLTEEHQAHPHFVGFGKAERLQRNLHFDHVAVAHGPGRAVPHHVGVELLAGCGGVDGVHLAAARIDEQVVGALAGAC